MAATEPLATLRQWLGAARLGPAARLPPERDMAVNLGLSRGSLRKALSVLEAEGAIQRHVGRGTFVNAPAADASEAIAAQTSPLAAMQARFVIEPELARLAARNATSAQLAALGELCVEMRHAPSWGAYVERDWHFHNLIAEATGNILLVEIQRLLNGVRRFVVWGNLIKRAERPPLDYHSFAEHEAILDAMRARDEDRTMRAMLTHLGGTQSQMTEDRRRFGIGMTSVT